MTQRDMADLNDELAMQKPFKLPEVETWRSPDAVRAQMAYRVLVEKALTAATALQVSIPDGWKLVPVEPTEEMVIRGFESAPSVIFSDPADWAAYEAMSGCQQAAHEAKLCYSAMLAAAPEVNGGKND
ncbi:hypothetical protein [Pantoea stewartii]|uniref:Uncharacterized protein n=2 Tax=Pantoea stewartii subsp. stewartii DC283 TaxID=660596 RepID=A0ABN4YZ53_PANSE|nr:hypothetical protein [Pantoea stewartii]ARF49617.1 hypothetical protein DSJ_09870 [Pantoea stewartii subsp. stewartii DC283]KAB0559980.1 hypothetical protein F7Q90_00890 [Pantoea stewartii subsp. stewartii]